MTSLASSSPPTRMAHCGPPLREIVSDGTCRALNYHRNINMHARLQPHPLVTVAADLIADIRHLVDQRPTYGYRRIAALLKRERRSAGREPVNAKRIFRLMKKHGLLLQPYTGRRRAREHDGKIITIRSNIRWFADALEFTCWNGEIVRM